MKAKVLSLIVVITLILGTTSVFGGEDNSLDLSAVIKKVKSTISIPENYTEFDSWKIEGKENALVNYSMSWSNKGDSARIYVVADSEGKIKQYNHERDEKQSEIGVISVESAKKSAIAFVGKIDSELAKRLKINTITPNYRGYDISYSIISGEGVIQFLTINLTVDKQTGQVIYYRGIQGNDSLNTILTKLPAGNSISKDDATNAYLDKIEMKLQYHYSYDYDKKALNIFAAYEAERDGKAIDAVTGEVKNIYYEMSTKESVGMGNINESKEKALDSGLTEAELKDVNELKNIISKTEAENKIKSIIPNNQSFGTPQGTSLVRNNLERDEYQWQVYFEKAYGVVNAKTGEIERFFLYDENLNNDRISKEMAEKKAIEFISKNAPEKFAQTTVGAISTRSSDVNSKSEDYMTIEFVRQVNDIDFIGNGMTININLKSGTIVSYNMNWFEKAEFPMIDKAIIPEKAFEIFKEKAEFGVAYAKTGKDEISKVYTFVSPDYFMVNADGKLIESDGSAYKSKINIGGSYSDINGKWYEKQVSALYDNGYKIAGDVFNGNMEISQEEFLRYLYSQIEGNYNQDKFYKYMEQNEIIIDGEKAPTKQLSRYEAAMFSVRYLSVEKAAKDATIFTNPFNDKIDGKYKSYAALAYGMDIMQGDKYGKFNGTKGMTRAESAVVIYNILNQR